MMMMMMIGDTASPVFYD